MKVLLVNPPRFNGMPVGREDRCENTIPNVIPPMGLVYLAGMLQEQGHSVNLIDANGYNLDFEDIGQNMENNRPEFVIFRSTPETFYSDIKVADIAKSTDNTIKTIMICWTLTVVPEEVLKKAKNVDYYILDYNYEKPILKLLNGNKPEDIDGIAFKEDAIIRINPPDNEVFNFNSISMPAWHLIPDFSVYWVQVPSISPYAFVESMKGCGLGCTFCTITDVKPNFRNVKKVVDEIEYLYFKRGVRYIGFFDATFNLNKRRVFEICDEIIKRNMKKLKWFANIRADRMDEGEAKIMKEAGCEGVSVGVESGSQKVLDLANKKLKVSDAARTVKILKTAGIKQYASFIVGLPGETLETMNLTRKFILETKPTGFQVNSLVPYPRSKVYDIAIHQGKMKELQFEDLLLYNSPVSLCDLSTEEINEFRKKIYKDVYLSPGWWLSNIKGVIKNPADIRLGIDYTLKAFRRLVKGVDYET
jgi:radical SAM superfamily enzyme YgiQ (UPF0313 family)